MLFPDYFYSFLHHYISSLSDPDFGTNNSIFHVFVSSNSDSNETPLIADSDAKIDRIYFDFDKITSILDLDYELSKKGISKV